MCRWHWENVEFESLVGKVFQKVEQFGNEELEFTTVDGEKFLMYHEQDCCEWVRIEDIEGDLNDLIGQPILMAEEVTQCGDDEDSWNSQTWTFYKLATIKGTVTLRWLGESNGYYSESVDFVKVPKEEVELQKEDVIYH
ncbi:hypothetical protein PDQ75_25135 [Bacillus cereus group sp. Bc015]|uniref:DUF7448 domain-containing protein n=1 Tax=Bacillus cereus group sp. Bc015 TaxID=3018123 RepID=UPI0022E31C82|nr:hypothetical protein [Bacillus cereus group sp. Bc015]MDA2738442.1 hypothetical protein [Bacillus cereus group sp. Bc015]